MPTRVGLIRGRLSGKVLDAGFNVSTLHWELKKKFDIVGIDVCIKKPEKNIAKADAQCLPFKSGSFDSVLAGELVEHLKSPEAFVKEAGRVLKKRGTLIVTTPNVKSLINRVFRSYHAPAHISLFTKQRLLRLMEENSLEMEFYTLFPYTEESSEGSRHRWLFAARKFLHPFLPKGLQEQMFIVAKKI